MRRRAVAAAVLLLAIIGLAGCGASVAGPVEVRVAGPAAVPIPGAVQPVGSGELAMPHLAFVQTSVAVFDTLPKELVDLFGMSGDYRLGQDDELNAPEEHEFLIATLQRQANSWRDQLGASSGEASVRVVVDRRVTGLAVFESAQEHTVLVMARKGREVTVQIRDAGAVASMDLRTGIRADDEMTRRTEPYYPLRNIRTGPVVAQPGPAVATSSLKDARGRSYTLTLSQQSEVTRQPWVPALGWAGADRSWLMMHHLRLESSDRMPEMNLSVGENLTLRLDSGAVVQAQTPPESVARFSGVTFVYEAGLYFKVPAADRRFVLTFAPIPTVISDKYDLRLGTWKAGTSEIRFG